MQGVSGFKRLNYYIFYKPVNNRATKIIIGVIYSQTKKMKISRKIRLYLEKNCCNLRVCLGKSPNKIFEPSSGGIGIKLKIAKTMFVKTTITDSSTNDLPRFKY